MGRKQIDFEDKIQPTGITLKYRDDEDLTDMAYYIGLTKSELLEAVIHGILKKLTRRELLALIKPYARVRRRSADADTKQRKKWLNGKAPEIRSAKTPSDFNGYDLSDS